MLREGLNHVDRVPHTPKAAATSAWARHIRAHYRRALLAPSCHSSAAHS